MTLPSDDEARRLLRALPPLGNVDAMRESVRLRLDAKLAPAPWFANRRRAAAWAGGLGLAFAAVAATAFLTSGGRPEPSSPPSDKAVRTPATETAASVADAASKVQASAAESAHARPVPVSRASASTDAPATTPVRSVGPKPAPLPSNLIYQAATALRRDGNPRAALELLDQYAKTSPQAGASEEALALRMEAYYRLGSPQAGRLAESYLKSFPQGRFRQTAENIASNQTRTKAP